MSFSRHTKYNVAAVTDGKEIKPDNAINIPYLSSELITSISHFTVEN